MHELLFPELSDRRWMPINLDEHARHWMHRGDKNPLLDPQTCADWVNSLHAEYDVEFSYGGYMEDRSFLWRGHYMLPGAAWHLGIDYNVPQGTAVHLPVDADLITSELDTDQNGGWGGRLIFRVGKYYLILAHLTAMVRETRKYKAGDLVGLIGTFPDNGNWFPHLHVQAVNAGLGSISTIDGYSRLYGGIENEIPRPDCIL